MRTSKRKPPPTLTVHLPGRQPARMTTLGALLFGRLLAGALLSDLGDPAVRAGLLFHGWASRRPS